MLGTNNSIFLCSRIFVKLSLFLWKVNHAILHFYKFIKPEKIEFGAFSERFPNISLLTELLSKVIEMQIELLFVKKEFCGFCRLLKNNNRVWALRYFLVSPNAWKVKFQSISVVLIESQAEEKKRVFYYLNTLFIPSYHNACPPPRLKDHELRLCKTLCLIIMGSYP